MTKYLSFVSWMFRGWYRDLSTWGLILGFVALNALILEASLFTVYLLVTVAFLVVFIDLVVSFVRFQYGVYLTEQDRIVRELEKK